MNLGKHWNEVLEYDIAGYYAYLPATFIYKDLQFSFYDKILEEDTSGEEKGDFRQSSVDDKIVNKYFVGTAILQLPFFAVAHLVTLATGGEANGYSYWYIFFIAISSVLYGLLGLYFLSKILTSFGLRNSTIWIVILSITFGTNFFVYTSIDPGTSHTYSFACVNAFIWFFILFNKSSSRKLFFILALLLGLILLIRPINVIFLLGLPVFLDSFREVKSLLLKFRKLGIYFILGCLFSLLIVSIQLLIYKLQTGSWFLYSYAGESFNFTNPQIFNFLFSFRKGYFLYTPLAMVSILSLYAFYKYNKFKALSLCVFLIAIVYVFSSWWSWWYGGSFSSRVMLEYSLFVFLPLGFLIQKFSGIKYKLFIGFIVIVTIFSQIQIYQFRHGQIHYADTSKELYLENFMRIDKLLK